MQEKLWTAALSAVARAELMQLLRTLSSAMYHLLADGRLGCDGWMWGVWMGLCVCVCVCVCVGGLGSRHLDYSTG